jgi:hypothetical protein
MALYKKLEWLVSAASLTSEQLHKHYDAIEKHLSALQKHHEYMSNGKHPEHHKKALKQIKTFQDNYLSGSEDPKE